MITKNGKRVVFSDDKKKAEREALKVELEKHTGKPVRNLSKKELEDALAAALNYLGMVDNQGEIKNKE